MKRIVFLDYVRVFACFLVMVVHASENFYGAEGSTDMVGPQSYLANEADRLWVAVYDGFSRMAVPLFIIVSAFLLAPMKAGLTSWQAGHLWFMYPLISLYLFIPVISPWLNKATAKEERFFIGLFLLSTCMPYLNRCFGEVWGQCFWNEYHILWYFSGYLGYLVLAHYIHVHLTWHRSKRLVIGIASMLVGALLTIYSFYVQAIPGVTLVTPEIEIGWAFCTINCVLLTAGTFLAFTCIGNSKSPRLITEMSKLSYGMYLMHIFWLGLWVTVFKHDLALPTVAAIPCIAVSTFICCYVTTKIISLIPGSKWIIG